jgi:phospholipase/lecithinase/hemolysin
MAAAVNTLEVAGACNFLVLNLPPLGRTPMFLNNDAAAAGITALAEGFNTDLAAGLASLDGIGKTILLHDAYSDFTHILATPSQFGLQNTTGQVMDTGFGHGGDGGLRRRLRREWSSRLTPTLMVRLSRS